MTKIPEVEGENKENICSVIKNLLPYNIYTFN